MSAGTKALHRFQQRCGYFVTDLALCGLLVHNFSSIPNTGDSLAVALGSTDELHPELGQVNSAATRRARGGHLKRVLAESFVKDLYEDFVDFVRDTVARGALAGVKPGRFVGDVKLELRAQEVLGAGDWDGVVTLVSKGIFRELENEQNTVSLIRKSATRLGLTIDPTLIDAAMPYLEARHMLVHQDGKADPGYRRRHPAVVLKEGRIRVDADFVAAAHRSVGALAGAIDAEVVVKGLVRPEHLHTGPSVRGSGVEL